MELIKYLLPIIFLGTVPALFSIRYLMPNESWSLRIKVIISRGILLKIPFGVCFGFLGILLIALLQKGLIEGKLIWFYLGVILYLFLIWLYLFLYRLLLNRGFNQSISWSVLINSIIMELGISLGMVLIAAGFAIVFDLTNGFV
ncbi:hypothetical protein F0238_21310 [Vibrio coralliilyticus]|uniref:Uncharacterized protein n=1 Tax=Vibrio coralliilyticus TaxID=190893 RepID=A0AAP7DFU4_9VIBR|nr:hypothetical protein [Vibrio coralliilyticus]